MPQFMLMIVAAMMAMSLACTEDGPANIEPTTEDAQAPEADGAMESDAAEPSGDAQPMVEDAQPMAEDAGSPPADAAQAQCIIEGPNCEPGAPHNDMVGMVCANDGTDEEAYCALNDSGEMICARSENGGPCEGGGTPGPTPDAGMGPGPIDPGDGTLTIRPMDADDPLSEFFEREINVFGIRVVASANVPDAKLSHAAHIMAEYLDNDEDGAVDDPPVLEAMQNRRAILVMFGTFNELENSGIFESNAINGYWGQDLYADETAQPGRFDAALEEVLHLITTAGYEQVYPDAFGSTPGTLLTDAMDLARAGQFMQVPNSYPEEAWYHYDDRTCDYRCMAVEYFYWALTTLLGAQESAQRCAEIRVEWEPCTAEALEMTDPAVHALLTDPQYKLPTRLPDGNYQPPE